MMKRPVLLLSAALLVACNARSPEPDLRIADRLVWSEAPILVATGLEAGERYRLETERISFWDAGAAERSSLTYTADEAGRIDTSAQSPEEMDEVSPYLPIREMAYLSDTALDGIEAGELRLRLIDPSGTEVARRTVGIGPDMAALLEEPLGDDFPGAYVIRSADRDGPAPAIVLLGGSEGGDQGSRATAPIFAAEGYTVLGLPYYSPAWWGQEPQFPDLPRGFAELPVDYLEDAVALLRQRPDVDPDRILLQGGSKGAEYVLLAGSLIPDSSPGGGFCGIVADVPSDVVWEGWGPGTEGGRTSGFSWRGEALPFVPYTDMARALDRDDAFTMTQAHETGRRDHPDLAKAARIRVETIDEPVLVIGGDLDTTWASGRMARTIAETRAAAGLETESYVYPEGSHGVGGTPLARTRAANLEARLENFPATMAFIARAAKRVNCRK
ncbi:MAG: acyl-CoA thioester hydrolase/BAAT C-terminal domain-containing protein [Litorimonas sp.]